MFEERSGHSTDLPSTGTSGRRAHLGCLPGLLSDGDAEASAAAPCSRIDTTSGAGETRRDSDVGCLVPHHRWPPTGHATLHRTGPRAGATPASAQVGPAATTTSAHQRCCLVSSLSPTPNVVETFDVPLLKTKGIPALDLPNCEGWAKGDRGRCQHLAHVEIPKMLSGPGIERHQLPVVIAEEDHSARCRHRARPHGGGSRHRVLPAALS